MTVLITEKTPGKGYVVSLHRAGFLQMSLCLQGRRERKEHACLGRHDWGLYVREVKCGCISGEWRVRR